MFGFHFRQIPASRSSFVKYKKARGLEVAHLLFINFMYAKCKAIFLLPRRRSFFIVPSNFEIFMSGCWGWCKTFRRVVKKVWFLCLCQRSKKKHLWSKNELSYRAGIWRVKEFLFYFLTFNRLKNDISCKLRDIKLWFLLQVLISSKFIDIAFGQDQQNFVFFSWIFQMLLCVKFKLSNKIFVPKCSHE